MTDLTAVKTKQQQMWSAGDYSMVGTSLVLISELLCESVDLHAGHNVLDVATGSGNTALAAARCGGEVTGVDYVPALLDRAIERAAAERLSIDFRPGDAENLPFPDASFDAVLSTLGVMFAPDQERAAHELLRVCRPGGKIGLASWTPDGFVGEWFRAVTRYLPQPPELRSPLLWGTEERVQELFGDGVSELRATRRSFVFRYRTRQHWLEFFQAYYGPTVRAFETLDPAARESLESDLLAVARRFNRSGDETLVAPSDYLEVAAVRAG